MNFQPDLGSVVRFVLDEEVAGDLPEHVRTVFATQDGAVVFASEDSLEPRERDELLQRGSALAQAVRAPWQAADGLTGGQLAWYDTAWLVEQFPHYAGPLGHLAEQIRLALGPLGREAAQVDVEVV